AHATAVRAVHRSRPQAGRADELGRGGAGLCVAGDQEGFTGAAVAEDRVGHAATSIGCYNADGFGMTVATNSHIVIDDRGRPIIAGTRTKVIMIVMDQMNGMMPEKIHEQYPYL